MIYCLCRGSTGGRDLCHSRDATSATCWFRSAPRQHEGPALLSPVCCWSGCSTGNVVWESRDSDAIAGTSDVFLWILKFYAWLTLTVPLPFPWGLPMPDPWSRTCPGRPWDLLSQAQDSLALWCPGCNSVGTVAQKLLRKPKCKRFSDAHGNVQVSSFPHNGWTVKMVFPVILMPQLNQLMA